MRTTESVVVPATPSEVYPFVAALDRYPAWLRLVHDAVEVGSEPEPAWSVELRARVGPFARSKQLRMVRVTYELDRLVEFERAETDGRDHARWSLSVELAETEQTSTLVTMRLAYDGALWTAGLLERVLDEEIRKGRAGLVDLVSVGPRH